MKKISNCRNSINFPLENKCLTEPIVYQCTILSIENPSIKKLYIGSAINYLELRWYQHFMSFNNNSKKHPFVNNFGI